MLVLLATMLDMMVDICVSGIHVMDYIAEMNPIEPVGADGWTCYVILLIGTAIYPLRNMRRQSPDHN